MTTVVALGGNALARRGEAFDLASERRNVARAAEAVAAIARHDWVVVTHGNGPQVGMLAMQDEAVSGSHASPLDVLDAETEGMIGYLLEQELGRLRSPDLVATLLTQVVVDEHDPAFTHPTKPIGPVFDERRGHELAAQRGWVLGADGDGVRRVVASPDPHGIVQLNALRLLLSAGILVIAGGGGGIPVVADPSGGYRGVEAVVDKDLTAALIADRIGASILILLTDVDAVYDGWDTGSPVAIRRAGVDGIRRVELAAGSMAPKVEAACRFAGARRCALIGSIDDVEALLERRAGTEIVASGPVEYRVPVASGAG